jgi:predicted O-methyltransferase YrrM
MASRSVSSVSRMDASSDRLDTPNFIDPAADDADTAGIRDFNLLVRDDPTVDVSLVPMADGITLIRKKR